MPQIIFTNLTSFAKLIIKSVAFPSFGPPYTKKQSFLVR